MRMLMISIIFSLVASCAMGEPLVNTDNWSYKKIELSKLEEVEAMESDFLLIGDIKKQYQASPYDPDYREIELFKILKSLSSDQRYFVFDILYVDDTQAVYVVSENGKIVDHFLYSAWQVDNF